MQIEREGFISALARVKPALGAGGVVHALTHIWFDKKTLCAYDGGFGIRLAFKSELDCGVPGKPFIDLLQTSSLPEAVLEMNGASLQVKLGKATSKIAALEGQQRIWPYPSKLPKGATATELGSEFIEALRKALLIKASSASRVEHYGVMVQREKQHLALFSTDSATMARVVVEGAGKGANFDRVLLPRNFAEQLVSQSPDGAALYVLNDCIIAEAEGISFFSNMMDVSAADDMGAVMTRKSEQHPEAVALPPGLEGALARAEILAGREEPLVELGVEGANLHVVGDYALGALKEALPLEGKSGAAKIRVKAGLLRRVLPHVEAFSIQKDSLILRGEPNFVYLVAAFAE